MSGNESQTVRSGCGQREKSGEARLLFREPSVKDGEAIWRLVDQCKPLDLNSCYAYLLIGRDFSETSVVAQENGRIVGFVSAYRPPGDPGKIFVWQVAVHPSQRGKGLGRLMLAEILGRKACEEVRFLETTVTPSNKASRGMFASLAREMGSQINEEEGFPAQAFPKDQRHEEERLLRIGPFNAQLRD